MNPPALTFFNNKAGVGKTSLIYHLAWMFASLGKRVVAVDLDPQANLTAAFLDEERIEAIWEGQTPGSTIHQCVAPLASAGDILEPKLQNMAPDLYLLPGDVNLSGYEDALSNEWANSMGDNNLYRPMRMLSSFWQVMRMAAKKVDADIIFVDIGPNLGAINRSALIATDDVVIPLGADLFSLQGLKNLGPALKNWKNLWNKRRDNWKNSRECSEHSDVQWPLGKMRPVGYLCQPPSVWLGRPITVCDQWVKRIPNAYRQAVLEQEADSTVTQADDPYCLATMKHYRSLVQMGREHRKPIFNLTSADGAIGSHASAVKDAKIDFYRLAKKIAHQTGMVI